MRLFSSIFAIVFAGVMVFASPTVRTDCRAQEFVNAPQIDSAYSAALDAKLSEYLQAIEREPVRVKCDEVDFLISSSTDSLVTQQIATKIYSHYIDSKLMGDEAVAIYVFDNWFAPGKVKMLSDNDFIEAEFFSKLNRPSLIGKTAPSLTLHTHCKESVTIFPEHKGREDRRWRIAYFYDVDCAKCKVESIMLRNILNLNDFDAILYAIYVGSEAKKWEEYGADQLTFDTRNMEVVHLWDPDMTSDFVTKYAVISTPKLYLIDRNGIIVGRGLDASALEQLLSGLIAAETLEYGSEKAMEMYEETFAAYRDSDEGLNCSSVSQVAAYISDKLLPAGDTLLYKQMTGDLLYYLTNQREANYKCGTEAFLDDYILGREDIWNTQDDSLKVVSLAEFIKSLLSLCPIGEPIPETSLLATVLKPSSNGVKSVDKMVDLNKLKNAIVIFHTEGCDICKAEIGAAKALLDTKSGGSGGSPAGTTPKQIVLVDMDELWSTHPEQAGQLMENIDLSVLPFILATDKSARVSQKYIELR